MWATEKEKDQWVAGGPVWLLLSICTWKISENEEEQSQEERPNSTALRTGYRVESYAEKFCSSSRVQDQQTQSKQVPTVLTVLLEGSLVRTVLMNLPI